MKILILFFVVVMSILMNVANSQNLIVVQNGGIPTFYLQVDSAIIHSQDGDTIYLPGGTWNVSTWINKRLHIIGVGHNPDSTNATFPTKILTPIILSEGASHGTLTGVFLNSTLVTGLDVSSYTVKRCHLSSLQFDVSTSNFTFIENIIDGEFFLNGLSGGPTNCSFFNNILGAAFIEAAYHFPFLNSSFRNNIFLYGSSCGIYATCRYSIWSKYSIFENNVFLGSTSNFQKVSNSIVNNNLFCEYFSFETGTNNGINNIINQSPINTVINPGIPNDIGSFSYSYSNDYHLQTISPGKNAGTDGTDIGIYGGSFPWKEGSVPFNPHIQHNVISNSTDQNGNLIVNIKVAAQDH